MQLVGRPPPPHPPKAHLQIVPASGDVSRQSCREHIGNFTPSARLRRSSGVLPWICARRSAHLAESFEARIERRSTTTGRYSGASGHTRVKRLGGVVNNPAAAGWAIFEPRRLRRASIYYVGNAPKGPEFLPLRPTFVSPDFSRDTRKRQAQVLAGPGVKNASAVTACRTGRVAPMSRVVGELGRG